MSSPQDIAEEFLGMIADSDLRREPLGLLIAHAVRAAEIIRDQQPSGDLERLTAHLRQALYQCVEARAVRLRLDRGILGETDEDVLIEEVDKDKDLAALRDQAKCPSCGGGRLRSVSSDNTVECLACGSRYSVDPPIFQRIGEPTVSLGLAQQLAFTAAVTDEIGKPLGKKLKS